MPITFVAERATMSESAAATLHPFTPTDTLAAGSLAVVAVGCAASVTFSGSDSAGGNTWGVAKQQANGTSSTVGILWSLLVTPVTTSNTVTVSTGGSSQTCAGALWEFTGAAAAPADQTAGATGASSAVSVGPTSTLTQADELVVAAFVAGMGAGATVTFTAQSGYSQASAGEHQIALGSFQRTVAGEYLAVASTAAVTSTGLWAISTDPTVPPWAGAVVTFMAATIAAPVVAIQRTFSPIPFMGGT